jgi:hypothetical protein
MKQTTRRKTIFFGAKHRRLADIISIESPAAFRRSIRELAAGGLDRREKSALVLARTRAKVMLRKKDLSEKERKQLREIASTPLPSVTKRTPATSHRRRSARSRTRSAARGR